MALNWFEKVNWNLAKLGWDWPESGPRNWSKSGPQTWHKIKLFLKKNLTKCQFANLKWVDHWLLIKNKNDQNDQA